MKNQYYIGIGSTFHDPAIAILNHEGKILFAEGVERHIQNKRAMNCIADDSVWAMKLLEKYCPNPDEVIISTTWNKQFLSKMYIKASLGIFKLEQAALSRLFRSTPSNLLSSFESSWMQKSLLSSNNQAGMGFLKTLKALYPNTHIRQYRFDHHLTHAQIACHGSSFDDGVCVIVDGSGENGSFSIFSYKNNEIKKVFGQNGIASLGFYYIILTQLCGFDPDRGEQWKVMGLAPYGKLDPEAYRLLKSLYKFNGYRFKNNYRNWTKNLPKLALMGRKEGESPLSIADLAFTGQKVFEEWMTEILHHVYDLGISDNLIYSGGCALNSAYNGKILDETPFQSLYIPSAPGDDGCALGASMLAYYQDHPSSASLHQNLSPFHGTRIENVRLSNLIKFGKIPNIRRLPDKIYEETAKLLADGKIVGWVQGRAEYGPRALGNRSILADPRSPKMKEEINARVKFREAFRPFAPSILHEFGEAYFENYQYSPYMERTLTFKKEVRESLPAVVHANHTGRLQSVTRELNPQYHRLITEFYKITGVPVVLNTSFNVMGKPIIHSVEDAISVFYTTGLDALVIGEYLITKEERKEKKKELAFVPFVNRM